MKVLVTGCHGFLGHHVTALLLKRGHEVLGVDRITGARSPKAARIAAFERFGERARFVEGNLAKWDFAREVIAKAAPAAIFHAAAQYSIRYTTENLKHYIHGNLVMPVLVLEAAALAGVGRFIYASSQSISDERRPSGLYGASKGFGEEALAAYWHRHKLAGVALRYGVLYGPMIRPDTDFFRTVNDHLAGREAKPGSMFDRHVPLIEISDAAELAVRAIEADTTGTITLPAVAPDPARTYRQILHAAAAITGKPVRTPTAGPVMSPRTPPDMTRVRDVLGWSPRITLPQGLERYIAWARTATT